MKTDNPDVVTEVAKGRPSSFPSAALLVDVIEGEDRGARLLVDASAPGALLVGTSAACQLVVTDRQVSRRHASLELAPGGLRVRDLGSTNGTFVGDARVFDAVIGEGARVRLGQATVLSVARSDAPVKLAPSGTGFGRIVGASAAMRRLYPVLERLATTELPVLVEGESGTGKELLAEVLHEKGPRAGAPFVVLDVTSHPEAEIEAELFGDEARNVAGALGRATGGTLLVKEISALPSSAQARLARMLDASSSGGPPDVRFVATSRRDLDQEVEQKRFRDDLFFALAPGRVELPPLRARGGDVALLAEHYWRRLGRGEQAFPADFTARHDGYAWPGNVRELIAAVARRLALGDAASEQLVASAEAMPDNVFDFIFEQDLAYVAAREVLLTEFERRYVARALERHGGNISRAAAASGLARRSFQLIRARHRSRG